MSARPLALTACLALILATSSARAERCGPAATAWIERCAQSSKLAMRLEACPSAVALVEVTPASAAPLRLELSTSTSAFRRAGPYGVSPVGDFPDWQAEPAARRAALDAFMRCVEHDPPVPLLAADAAEPVRSGDTPTAVARTRPPLLLLCIGALAALGAITSWASRRPALRAAALSVLAVVATVLVRRALAPAAFFHQNGQGPEWVRYALQGDAGAYGPGYPELLGRLASRATRPDLLVFSALELLTAATPLFGYLIARRMNASRAVAAVLGVTLAIDPLLARISRSESYYAPISAMLFASAGLLCEADRARRRTARLALSLAAALAAAQAARVHPLAWLPSALIPLVLASRPGRIRRRSIRVLSAGLLFATVACVLVLPGVIAAMRGRLGDGAGFALRRARDLAPWLSLLVVPAVAAVAVRRSRAVGSRILVLAIVIAAAVAPNLLTSNIAAVHDAYLHLFVPAGFAAVAALAARVDRRVAVPAIALLATAHFVVERPHVKLTTDSEELRWCVEWRETLPAGAEVAWVGRAGERLLFLPLLGQGLPRAAPIDADGRAALGGAHRYYYRSSLCATPEGASACSRFEAAHRLRLLGTRTLAARESAPWMRFPNDRLDVALFEIE